MVKFVASAALVSLVVAVAVPASAEVNYGPRVQNGKCWQPQVGAGGGGNAGTWGYWTDCPRAAATTTQTTLLRHPLRARRDPHNDR